MEIGNLSISRQKQNSKETNKPPKMKDVKRLRNWTASETEHLLDAIDTVQTNRGERGFRFKEEHLDTIFALFNEKVKDHPFDRVNIVNRMKVLKNRFTICYELASLTGGGWDEVVDRPKAPSYTDYEAMIQAKGPKATFLLKSSFPWYNMMLPMLGEKPVRGEGRESVDEYRHVPNLHEPSLSLPLLQGPIQISQQGSSDEPDELTNGDSDAVEQPQSGHGRTNNMGKSGRVGGQCSRGGRQSAESSFPASEGSGSKRKSTDESAGETSGRGNRSRRYRENALKKKAEGDTIAQAGFEIARFMKVDAEKADKKEACLEACMEKIYAFGIAGAAQVFLIEKLEKSSLFRMAFLKWTTMDDVDFFAKNNYYYCPPGSDTSNPTGFNGMFHNFQSQANFQNQGFPSNNQGNFQNQGFPSNNQDNNQGSNNYSYPLNHPNL